MSVISELIRSEADGTISFGDYTLTDKKKLDNYKHEGDLYKVKTFADITKLVKAKQNNKRVRFTILYTRDYIVRIAVFCH